MYARIVHEVLAEQDFRLHVIIVSSIYQRLETKYKRGLIPRRFLVGAKDAASYELHLMQLLVPMWAHVAHHCLHEAACAL